jgi:2-polyprenyl-3-methyl-5-hydroxy-6-metoxy-1,4-benzoquinol methylase
VSLVESRHLSLLRKEEIETVRSWFKAGMRVLEIGGGNGYQASVIASWGCEVNSIDLPRAGAEDRYHRVQEYDGEHIPFTQGSFDMVFSSNVLEHIPHLPIMLEEMRRVLVPGGVMIHILPSAQWRLWTSLSHYPFVLKQMCSLTSFAVCGSRPPEVVRALEKRGPLALLKRGLSAGPHGEYPNALYELYAFSKRRWLGVWGLLYRLCGIAATVSRFPSETSPCHGVVGLYLCHAVPQ